MNINQLNTLDDNSCYEALERCCGSSDWIIGMMNERPFINLQDIMSKADQSWATVTDDGALEAFEHHPRIGDRSNLAKKFASTHHWAGDEQKSVKEAHEEIINKLAKGNKTYEEKFGYIFIVCATGKSAKEMLEILTSRLKNDEITEIKIAKAEQHKITKLRLKKLLE